jgi:hypothetical protein
VTGAQAPNLRFYSVSDSGLETSVDSGVIAIT